MKIIPPITITDTILTSSTVPDVVYVANVNAYGTITVSGTPLATETFVVGSQTFTFKASGTATGDVVIGGTNNATATNIKTSLDRDISGTVTTVKNSLVLTLTAIAEGTEGNSVVLTESATGIAVSGSGTLAGGINEVLGNVEWATGTTYAVGDEVVITATHTMYESLRTPNTNKPPATNLTGLTPYWLELGKTNRWCMFDTTVSSQTSNPSSIVVVLTPGVTINSVAALNVNATTVTFLMMDGVTTRYNEHVHPATTVSTNIVKTDLPSIYPAATLTVTIENTGDNATCGFLIIGTSQTLGTTRPTPTISLIDYSVKAVDTFGNYSITERSYSRRIECDIITAISSLITLKQLLSQYRATPMVWIASELYAITILYGFCKDFLIGLPDYHLAATNLTIEGLI